MNILFLTNHLNIGGITSYLYSLGHGLKNRGDNIYIASSGGDMQDAFIKEGINFIPVPLKTKAEFSLSVFLSFFKLLPLIKEKNIDLIHANTRVTQILASLLSRFSSAPYISTCHGFFKKRIFRLIFPCWGKIVIAISQQVKMHLRDDFKVKDEDIRLVHNGIDLERFSNKFRPDADLIKQELGLKPGPVVGIVARLSDVKGHVYLVEAISSVAKEIPQVQLLIIGEGKILTELINLSKRLAVEDKVYFVTSVTDTRKVLSVMDIFVMPSLKEGLGLALMEAMALGIAVIGSEVGGIKTLIANGYNGLLVAPANTRELSQAIAGLLKDPDKRKIFGANARDFIAKNFSVEKMVSQTQEVYKECLNSKK